MKSKTFLVLLFFVCMVTNSFAQEEVAMRVQLPFQDGARYECTQNSYDFPTHEATSTKYDLDFGLSAGSIVTAAADGTVELGDGEGFGNYIKIDHGNGYFTFYAHLMDNGYIVEGGQRVVAGQPIGFSGNTGTSISTGNGDGSHLHFGVHEEVEGSNVGESVRMEVYAREYHHRGIFQEEGYFATGTEDERDCYCQNENNKGNRGNTYQAVPQEGIFNQFQCTRLENNSILCWQGYDGYFAFCDEGQNHVRYYQTANGFRSEIVRLDSAEVVGEMCYSDTSSANVNLFSFLSGATGIGGGGGDIGEDSTLSFQSFRLSSKKRGPWSDDTFHVAEGKSFYARTKLTKERGFSEKIRGKVKYYYRSSKNDPPNKHEDPYLDSDRFKIRPREAKEKEVTKLRIKKPGTHYLYCRVTWREDGEKKEIYSEPIKVVVGDPDPAITKLVLNRKTNLLYFDPKENIQVAATVTSPGPRLRRNLLLKYYFLSGWHFPQSFQEANLLKKGSYLANDRIRRGEMDDGEVVTRHTRFNLPADPGSQYTVLVILSGTGKDDKSNNFRVLPLTILDPTALGDLTFLKSSFLPSGQTSLTVSPGEEVLTGFTAQNQGEGRSDPAQFLLNIDNVLGSQLEIPSLLPTETFPFTLTVLESELGDYRLQGEIGVGEDEDPSNNLSEPLILTVTSPLPPPEEEEPPALESEIKITRPTRGQQFRCEDDDESEYIKWDSTNLPYRGDLTLYYRFNPEDNWQVIEKHVTDDGKRRWYMCGFEEINSIGDSRDAQIMICSEEDEYTEVCGISPQFFLDRAKSCR